MRRRIAVPMLVAVVLAILGTCAVGAAGIAGAASAPSSTSGTSKPAVVAVGWWTSAQIAGVPVRLSTLVPQGGLQVADGAQGPISIAAVRFAVPAATDAALVLHLAAGSTPETASLAACPVTGPWQPVSGAPLGAAPAWDCKLGTTAASYDPVARTVRWSFDAALVRGGVVDVMLLPVAASLPFNVTTDAPGNDAVSTRLHVGAVPPPAGGASSAPSESAVVAPTTVPSDGAAFATFAPGALTDPVPPLPAPAGLTSPLPTAPPAVHAALPVAAPASRRSLGVLLLVLTCAAALVLWRGWSFLPWGAAPIDGPRGVGRFARPRTDLPERI